MNNRGLGSFTAQTVSDLQALLPNYDELFQSLADRLKIERVAGKSTLFHEGEAITHVYWARSGLIKLQMHLPNGRTRIVRLCNAGQLIGLEGLLSNRQLFSAVTLFDADVISIPLADLQQLRLTDTQRYVRLLEYACFSLSTTEKWNAALSTGTIRARVARLLRFLAQIEQHPEHHCVILITCDDMSSLLGVTAESVSRVLASFKRQKLLCPMAHGGKACFRCDMPRLDAIALDDCAERYAECIE